MFARSSSNTYERLENGVGPGRSSMRFGWKKIAIGCGVLLCLVWYFGPRGDVVAVPLDAFTPGFKDIYPTQDVGMTGFDDVYAPQGGIIPFGSELDDAPPTMPSYPPQDIPAMGLAPSYPPQDIPDTGSIPSYPPQDIPDTGSIPSYPPQGIPGTGSKGFRPGTGSKGAKPQPDEIPIEDGLDDVPQMQTSPSLDADVPSIRPLPSFDGATADPSTLTPTSPETDPDPLGTVHCTEPYSPDLPLVQYALMIDAGSTGSRIHIYKFNHCGASPAYEYEVFKMMQPGLSDRGYATPSDAAASLDVLLDEALRVVPPSLQACTPVAVKATAGLRLLGARASEAILEAVEARLRTQYPFAVPATGGVVIMDGKDEGVYAWITVNYLMGAIQAGAGAGAGAGTVVAEAEVETETETEVGAEANADLDKRTIGKSVPTYAVLDLGGGSTQIVFEPETGSGVMGREEEVLKEGDHRYELAFGGQERVLYQHSYLGYGLKSARASVHRLVEFMDRMRRTRVSGPGGLSWVTNPCLAQGTSKEVDVPLGEVGSIRVMMTGEDVGNFESCNRILELVMAKDAVCEVKPCSFNGVYQPSLMDTFPTGKILLLSYFYDRIMPLIPPPLEAGQPRILVSTVATLARRVCAGPTSWKQYWGNLPEVLDELADRPEWCLDLTFMHALLGLGYEFADERHVELGKQIRGTELGWCLGATIAMVSGGGMTCVA